MRVRVLIAELRITSAFSSFPDSAQFDEGSEVHSFRIRVLSSELSRAAPTTDGRFSLGDDFVYGYSYFSQERDPSSKRGYNQVNSIYQRYHKAFGHILIALCLPLCLKRTIVILTYHPFPALFSSLMSKLGPLYQEHGLPMLEAACHNIANWYVMFMFYNVTL